MRTPRGSTRFLLVVAFSAATVMLGVSLYLIAGGGSSPGDGGDDVSDTLTPLPTPDEAEERARQRRAREAEDEEVDEEDDGFVFGPDMLRKLEGEEFRITPETLRHLLDERHWDALRFQIERHQSNGGEIPREIIAALLGLLEGDDTRIDAVLALGLVETDLGGQMLAEFAANAAQPLEVRLAALDALARSGQSAARETVQALLAEDVVDPKLARHALPALARMGGAESARAITEFLLAHRDDDLAGVALIALGKTKGAGEVIAQTFRAARDDADAGVTAILLKVAIHQGKDAEPELRSQVLELVQSAAALEYVEDLDARLRLRGSAIAAAAAMGGDMLTPVIQIVQNDSDGLRDVALHSLRNARGDDAAEQIVAALETAGATDEAVRRELVVALGQTGSRAATSTLVALLDDEHANVRNAAAAGLRQTADPKAIEPILSKLESAPTDHSFARNLVVALGKLGNKKALPRLQELRDASDPGWRDLRPWISQAITRIETGNPDSTRMR